MDTTVNGPRPGGPGRSCGGGSEDVNTTTATRRQTPANANAPSHQRDVGITADSTGFGLPESPGCARNPGVPVLVPWARGAAPKSPAREGTRRPWWGIWQGTRRSPWGGRGPVGGREFEHAVAEVDAPIGNLVYRVVVGGHEHGSAADGVVTQHVEHDGCRAGVQMRRRL